MNDNDNADDKEKSEKLAFMLSQLRDDIDDIVSGLQSGRLPHETARVAAATQIDWLLNQLGSEPLK